MNASRLCFSKVNRRVRAIIDDSDDDNEEAEWIEPFGGTKDPSTNIENRKRYHIAIPSEDSSCDEESNEEIEIDDDEDDDAELDVPKLAARSRKSDKARYKHDKPQTRSQGRELDVVDLCSDSEDSQGQRRGVRTPIKGPAFNLASRNFHRQFQTSAMAQGTKDNPELSEDDILEYWSSDGVETRCNTHQHAKKARRVTDEFVAPSSLAGRTHEIQMTSRLPLTTKPSRRTTGSFKSNVAQPGLSNWWKTDRQDRRRRLRDATTSNTAKVSGVVLKDPPSEEQFEQVGSSLWYRPNQKPAARASAPLRNDLCGGSGVGAGNYQLIGEAEDVEEDETENSSKRKTTRRTTRTKRSSASSKRVKKKKRGSKRKAWVGSGKASSTRKTGNTRSKNSRRSRKNNYENMSSNAGVWGDGYQHRTSSSFSAMKREDPDLKHIGGAMITF